MQCLANLPAKVKLNYGLQSRDNLILLLDETYAMRVNAMAGLFANKGISCQPIFQNVCQVPVYYGKGNSEDISYI